MDSAMGIQMENGTTKQVTVEEQNAEIAVCSRWAVRKVIENRIAPSAIVC
jgi:hypothetical protein